MKPTLPTPAQELRDRILHGPPTIIRLGKPAQSRVRGTLIYDGKDSAPSGVLILLDDVGYPVMTGQWWLYDGPATSPRGRVYRLFMKPVRVEGVYTDQDGRLLLRLRGM